ncbi:MAG: GerMN domain-containing protein, partial [Clostridia bacterium]|nr:GerMN domain-containing protein [Clostridia bacterium]
DENPKIRRLIPKISGCLTARMEDYNVTEDIKSEVIKKHPEGRDLELLTIYQIVNTLTGLDGVKTVRFTIDGKTQRNFMGYLDMRETYVPDYFV